MIRRWQLLILMPVLLLGSACARLRDQASTAGLPAVADGIADVVPLQSPAEKPPTAVPPTVPPQITAVVPSPTATKSAITATPAPRAEATTAAATPENAEADDFLQASAPQRDDVRLAVAFKGLGREQATATAAPPPAQIGDSQDFFIGNVDANTVSAVPAVLRGIGRYAYYWYDEGPGSTVPEADDLAATVAAFDAIYEDIERLFGDGTPEDDPPVHIVHASPLVLCAVDESTLDQCGLAGYFSSRDRLPRTVNAQSNEREMFVMNASQIGRETYLDVLAHELRHLIEARYDPSEADWVVEGSAMLAAQLAGYDDSAQWRGNLYLSEPDLQLNTWSETDRLPHYGQGYLLSRFLFDRLGEDAYRELATSPADGLLALDEVTGQPGYGLRLWQDWLVAMALASDQTGVPEQFGWDGPPLDRVGTVEITSTPYRRETDVKQFAADYYDLPSSGTYQVQFEGAQDVALLPAAPPSGSHMWYALRTNFANPRLTRTLDLRDVSSATLEYDAYLDVEQGYDFAYVSVSTDGGDTWQPLAADGMQGLVGEDDPSLSAMAERFYTGRLQLWVSERVDLSPFAGQVIDLRFEYITDPILTYGGFAIDNIRVPEIGFADDVESDLPGWTAEGFVRAPAVLSQPWHLWLITFGAEGVQAEALAPDSDGRLAIDVSAVAGEPAPMLIVAAHAPQTLEPAAYRLELND